MNVTGLENGGKQVWMQTIISPRIIFASNTVIIRYDLAGRQPCVNYSQALILGLVCIIHPQNMSHIPGVCKKAVMTGDAVKIKCSFTILLQVLANNVFVSSSEKGDSAEAGKSPLFHTDFFWKLLPALLYSTEITASCS